MNRTILVSGGNRGIGKAIVSQLSENTSDTILLGCRDINDGDVVSKSLGENVKTVLLDLSSRESTLECLNNIRVAYPQIDVLINNAAVLFKDDLSDLDYADFDQTIRVNLTAVFELSREILPQMVANGYGRIVNMSSGYGAFSQGIFGPFSYSISKTALNALTLTSSRDLPENVKVNCMSPGWVRTEMGGKDAHRSPEEGARTAVWLANIDEDGPNGKFFMDNKEIPW